MSEERQVYRVIFHNNGEVMEVYASQIYQSELYGFIEVEAFMFGERSGVVVDPAQEKLQSLFADVTRSFIPLHAVIRIDEVNTPGTGKITDSTASNITPFPYPPAPTKK